MLTDFKESVCQCDTCVSMCERRPCWPLPDEAQKLIEAGYGPRLMRDWWCRWPDDVVILSPAIVGEEGKYAPVWPTGRCTFLTDNKKCELHDKGLKPFEGHVAHHDGTESSLHK